MHHKTRIVGAALAVMVMLMALAAPSASASLGGINSAYLYTDGGADQTGSDWEFYVTTPPALGLDDAYWNLTVYAEPVNASATNATYYVHIHVNDGTNNVTKNVTLEAKNDVRVYSNASFAAADFAALVENTADAVLYDELLDGEGTVLDEYQAYVGLYSNGYVATIIVLMYALIPIMVIMMLFNYLKGAGKGPFMKR